MVLDDALDGLHVHPDVVGVEVPELLDTLELVDVLLGDLSDFEEADLALVVDNGTTLDIGLGLVGKLHDVLGTSLNHVLKDAEVDDGTQVVHVGQEDVLNTALNELVKNSRVVERLKNVTVPGRVPGVDVGVVALWDGQERVLEDTRIS